MARRTIFWHVGPHDVGTAWLGPALDQARDELAAAGVHVAGTTADRERVTAELSGTHRLLGLRRREVEGSSARLVDELWKHRGTSVVDLPGLAGASPDEIAMAMEGTRGAEHHLVLVERDLTSQLYAGARDALEQGGSTRPEHFAAAVLERSDQDPAAAQWWAGHDLPAIIGRWSRRVLPEHVHVVAEPSPELVWKRLVGLLGADLPLPGPAGSPAADLGASQLAVLREVSIALADRLEARQYRTTVRDWLSRELLSAQPGGGLAPLSADLRAMLRDTVTDWTDFCHRKGYDVQGTLRTEHEETGRRPINSRESASAALAEALVEVARLREENADLVDRNDHLDRKRRKHKSRAKLLAERQGRAARA